MANNNSDSSSSGSSSVGERDEDEIPRKRQKRIVVSSLTAPAVLTAISTDASSSAVNVNYDDLPNYTSKLFNARILSFGKSVFITNYKKSYVTKMKDYTILSDFDVSPFVNVRSSKNGGGGGGTVPLEIRNTLSERWIHSLHIRPTVQDLLTRNTLKTRVNGGQIVAYHYKECSIESNECVYYGFVPSTNILNGKTEGAHMKQIINSNHVWPRQLFVRAVKSTACSCSNTCIKVGIELFSRTTKASLDVESNRNNDIIDANTATTTASGPSCLLSYYCIKAVPWHDIYLMMGDADEDCEENQNKQNRVCSICSQCYKCSIRLEFCEAHKVCRHKQTVVDKNYLTQIVIPRIKKCNKLKSK